MEAKKSPRDIVIDRITEMIITGQYKPDDQLPPERDLAKSMGISRNLCSDVIHELEKRGLVIVVPRQGVFVNDFRASGNIYTLEAIMEADFPIGSKEIESVVELGWYMAELTCKRVIDCATDAQIAGLGDFIDKVLETSDPLEAAKLIYEYYHELAVLSGNTIVPMVIAGFKTPMINLWARYVQSNGIERLYKGLAEVYFFISNRDVDGVLKQINQTMGDINDGDKGLYKDN